MKKHSALAFCLIAASLAGAAAPTAAAETWPARPVKFVVGFAPGGPTDLFARLIAQKLTEQTGKISTSRTFLAPAGMSVPSAPRSRRRTATHFW